MSEQEDSDDDWFEQGLKEAGQSSDSEPSDTDSAEKRSSDTEMNESERMANSPSDVDAAAESWMAQVDTDEEAEPTDADSSGPWTDPADAAEAFGSATEGIDDPFTDGDEDDSPATADPEVSTSSSSWADSTDSDTEGLFDDEGFSGFEAAGPDEEEFSDEDFESDIARLDLGINGLDKMIQGGIPRRHLMVAIGGAGTGKTTFGLQFLHHGLQQGEKGVFITLEQSHEAMIETGSEWGWELAEYEEKDMLAIVDLDPVEMANSLDNIQAELPQLIQDFGADRLVLDSVSLLEMMYDNVAKRRTEVFDFTRSLKKAGVTTFLTSEASETNAYASRHGIIEYLTDAVFVLRYVRGDMQETRLAVEIQKIRNANHSRQTKPYELTEGGISVYQQANLF